MVILGDQINRSFRYSILCVKKKEQTSDIFARLSSYYDVCCDFGRCTLYWRWTYYFYRFTKLLCARLHVHILLVSGLWLKLPKKYLVEKIYNNTSNSKFQFWAIFLIIIIILFQTQFFLLFIIYLPPAFDSNCAYPKPIVFALLPQNFLMVLLFSKFYYTAYIKPKNKNTWV